MAKEKVDIVGLEEGEFDGEEATIAYLSKDFVPVAKDDPLLALVKVITPTRTLFLTPSGEKA